MKFRICFFSILAVFLFYFSTFVSGFVPFFLKYKADFTVDLLTEFSLDVLIHPIKNISENITNHNPLIYLSLLGSLVFLIYLIFKLRPKEYQIVGDSYGVQGSARWAVKNEIFNVSEDLTIVPVKELTQDIKNSLKGEVDNG
ncbi:MULTISPECIES: hypothetical protein [Bacillus amyloliquefaciens group]|uniref:hypothetical protein n=1 Tax=Bacillus amyloliquefaciens group TaxID=1938374 RepID=UPI000E2470FA|nr:MULTISPECIES: hypothetical protein [Bacillus amyloliquefaciens group]RDY83093.1 hypothetical protein C3733_19710 [Bacillus amyloliquefaciens]WFP05445.1 hypothetical protein JEQ22_20265 [Bacillus velezensis]